MLILSVLLISHIHGHSFNLTCKPEIVYNCSKIVDLLGSLNLMDIDNLKGIGVFISRLVLLDD